MWWTLRRWYSKSSNDPHDWIVVFDDSDCQGLTSLLDFQVTVTDVYDNIISNPEIILVSDAVDGLEAVAGGQYRWAVEGDHRVTLSVAEPHDPNAEPLTALFDVIIDATPPVITITSPERASMITGAATSMTVDMEIVDLLTPVSSVSVNDQDLTVSTGLLVQNLASVQNANWGLNVYALMHKTPAVTSVPQYRAICMENHITRRYLIS